MPIGFIKRAVTTLLNKLDKPQPALPLDIMRVGFGVLSAVYCYNLWKESADFSAHDGLIDHDLVTDMFPYTKMGLFHARLPKKAFDAAFAGGIVASANVASGIGVKPSLGYLYGLFVSTYRHNFIAIYVDDAIMHLVTLWLWLMPVGKTLTLPDLVRERAGAWVKWQTTKVPSYASNGLVANLCLLYVVAGLWKLTSPMWREGSALYAVLKTPGSRRPDFWQHAHLAVLKPANHAALGLELALGLLPFLPRQSKLKTGLGLGMAGFHVGIVATLKIPYANLACLATLPLLFNDELMAWLQAIHPTTETDPAAAVEPTPPLPMAVSTLLIGSLTLAQVWRLSAETHPIMQWIRHNLFALHDNFEHHRNPWVVILWLMGVAHSYRLFDWIDIRNLHVRFEVEEEKNGVKQPIHHEEMFPPRVRYVFLGSYLQNNSWFRIPPADLGRLQASLLTRFSNRYAKRRPNTGTITVWSKTTRISAEIHPTRRFKLLEFSCKNGIATVHYRYLNNQPI